MQARERFLHDSYKRLPHGDFKRFPEMLTAFAIIELFACCHRDEDVSAWFDLKVPIPGKEGQTCPPADLLMILGKKYPATVFGFFDNENHFVPGLLPLLARKNAPEDFYTDPLDEILCEETLSGKTIDEVVAMAGERGMKGCNNAVVRRRVADWASGKREGRIPLMSLTPNDLFKSTLTCPLRNRRLP